MWEEMVGKEIGLELRGKNYNPTLMCTLVGANNNGVFVTPAKDVPAYHQFRLRFYPWGVVSYLGLRQSPAQVEKEM